MQKTNTASHWGWLIVLALPWIGIASTFSNGIMRAADAPLHMHRIYAMGTLLSEGILYPRWVPWFHMGYGYPVFNFYPPGVFYLGGLWMQLGISAIWAFHLTAALAWIWGTLGTYRLARTHLPISASWIAATLWAYAPSRLFEIWTQGSLPQMMSAAFIPWVLYTTWNAAKYPTGRNSAWLGLALAGLVLTHQPMTFITALYVAPFTLILLIGLLRDTDYTFWKRARHLYGGILLGAGLASIFLIPVFLELNLVEAVEGTDDVTVYLQSNFLQLDEVLGYPQYHDTTDIRSFYPRTFGLIGLVLFALGMGAFIRYRQYEIAALLVVGFLFTLYMTQEISMPLWLTIPFFEQLRFPERLLRIGAVLVAVGGGASLLWITPRYRGTVASVVMVGYVLSMLPFVYPSQPFIEYDNLTALREIEFESQTYTWGTTSYNEFNPRWGDDSPYDFPPSAEVYDDIPNRIFPLTYFPYEQINANTFAIDVDEPQTLLIRQFYFPGWTARINGEPVEIYPESEYGLIALDVPAGNLQIELVYRGTTTQKIATIITLLSVGIMVTLFIRSKKPTSKTNDQTESVSFVPAFLATSFILGFAIFNSQWITHQTDWFRISSPPTDPTHMETSYAVTFGGDIELLGYTLNRTTISDNQPLSLTLFWHPVKTLTYENYRPVVQLVNQSVTESWAVSQPVFPGGRFTNSGDYTPERFTSDPHTLRLFDHAKPYTGYIMVQMVDINTNQPLTLENGQDHVILDSTVQITRSNPTINRVNPVQFRDSLTLICQQVIEQNDYYEIRLYWDVRQPVDVNLTTFVHGQNIADEIVAQSDQPPILDYPTHEWRKGQILESVYQLEHHPDITQIHVGLYQPDGTRLITRDSDGTQDDALLLDMQATHDCIMGN